MLRRVAVTAWLGRPSLGLALLFAGCGAAVAQDLLRAPVAPAGDIDWSVGLRGSYTSSSATGGHPELEILPNISWSRVGGGTQAAVAIGSALAVEGGGNVRVDDAHATASGTWRPGEFSTLTGNASLTYGQLRADDPSLPAGTTIGPRQLTGTVAGSAAYDFGHVRVTGRLGATRFIEGPTTTGGVSVDNAENSYLQGTAGLRVGYDLGPLLNVFVDGEARYTSFDAPSTSLLTYANGRTTTLRAGVGYNRNSILSAEISAGRSWYDYDDPSRTDQPGWVANGSLSFQPDETLTLTGALDTTLTPSTTSAGDTSLGLTASSSLRYLVNPWVTLRGTASAERTTAIGSGLSSWGYGVGGGFNLLATRYADWTGDYAYSHRVATSGAVTDSHKVTLGVTIHR